MNTDITIASYLADPMVKDVSAYVTLADPMVKDVSAYVTGLIGFAGGALVTATFRASLSSCSCPQIAL
jgi:catabolite regulation protein CreA